MASNSYRAAEYFAPIEDHRHIQLELRSRDAFRADAIIRLIIRAAGDRRRRSAVVWLLLGAAPTA